MVNLDWRLSRINNKLPALTGGSVQRSEQGAEGVKETSF